MRGKGVQGNAVHEIIQKYNQRDVYDGLKISRSKTEYNCDFWRVKIMPVVDYLAALKMIFLRCTFCPVRFVVDVS